MHIIKVPLKGNGYKIVVGSGIVRQLGSLLKPMGVGHDAVQRCGGQLRPGCACGNRPNQKR